MPAWRLLQDLTRVASGARLSGSLLGSSILSSPSTAKSIVFQRHSIPNHLPDLPPPADIADDSKPDDEEEKPSEDLCKHCAEVAEESDLLKSEFAQVNARLESVYAHLAGAQANIQSAKQRLMEAQEKWHANQRFRRL